jgi:hypothetical protein
MVLVLVMLTGALSTAVLAQPTAAEAASRSVDQCNGHGPGPEGATTALRCTVTVVNTIDGKGTSSVTTVTRACLLGPCSTPNGTFTTRSKSLVTTVQQCNNSDNDAAHAIICEVRITNQISASTPDAKPLTRASTNQCVSSGASTAPRCTPFPATAGAATVTQCNGSANGGGGSLDCSVDPASRVSRAIPIRVNQCNGSGNPGGSSVSCQASVITKISDAAAVTVAPATATPATTTTTTPTKRATAAPSASPTTARGELLVSGDSTDGPKSTGLLMVLAALVLVGALGALLYRRYAPATWPLVQRS